MSNEKHFTISSLTYFWSKIRQIIPFFHAFSNAQIDRITSTASSTSVPDFTQISQHVIEQYEGSNLAGVDQSVKSAIDDLGTAFDNIQSDVGIIGNKIGPASIANVGSSITEAIGNVTLPTTAQTITDAIAEHESDISTLNSNLTYTSESTQHLTAGSIIKIHGANVVYNEYMVMMRVQCSKIDGTVFATGRSETNPIFTINTSLKPIKPITFPVVTNNTVNGVMSNYANAYIATSGNVIVDIPSTNTTAKQIQVCVTYMR